MRIQYTDKGEKWVLQRGICFILVMLCGMVRYLLLCITESSQNLFRESDCEDWILFEKPWERIPADYTYRIYYNITLASYNAILH